MNMINNGASASGAEQKQILDYLTANFGPGAAPPNGAAAPASTAEATRPVTATKIAFRDVSTVARRPALQGKKIRARAKTAMVRR